MHSLGFACFWYTCTNVECQELGTVSNTDINNIQKLLMSDGNEFSDVCAARFNDPSDKDIRKSFSADGPADLLALDRLIAGSIELEQRLANVTELHAAMLDREYVATKFLGGTQENSLNVLSFKGLEIEIRSFSQIQSLSLSQKKSHFFEFEYLVSPSP